MTIRPLSKELQQVAEIQLNEKFARIEEDLKHIREWLRSQPHINARTDDQWLLTFLRGSKYSLQRAKEKLDQFYTIRNLMPEFFRNRDPLSPEIQEMLKLGMLLLLPKTDGPAGRRVLLNIAHKGDYAKANAIVYTKVLLMVLEICLIEDDNFVVSGFSSLTDLHQLQYRYMADLTPQYTKNIITCVQSVYPVRLSQSLFINTPPFFLNFFNLMKTFLKKKMADRYNFCGNVTDIYKYIPISILPKDYGGESLSCDQLRDELKKKVESYREWFLEDAQYCTDETKRPEKENNAEQMFGVVGSFRKLQID